MRGPAFVFLVAIAGGVEIFFNEEPLETLDGDDVCEPGKKCEARCQRRTPVLADNLMDAIVNFRELTSSNKEVPQEPFYGQHRVPEERRQRCDIADLQCRSCSGAMVEFFYANGFLTSRQVADQLKRQLGVQDGDHRRFFCSRYDFVTPGGLRAPRPDEDLSRTKRDASNNIKLHIEGRDMSRIAHLARILAYMGNKIQPQSNLSIYEASLEDLQAQRLLEAPSQDEGRRYSFSCVRRRVEPQSGWFQLCDSCWSWRQLPRRFRPRLLNELICSPTSSRCMSGLGTCKQDHTTLTVDEDLGNGEIRERQIQVASGCSCSLYKESPLQKLIES